VRFTFEMEGLLLKKCEFAGEVEFGGVEGALEGAGFVED